MNLIHSLSYMFLHMCSLLYDFLVIFIVLVCLLCCWPGEWGTWEDLSILTAPCRIEISRKNYTTNCMMCIITITMYWKISERCIDYIQGVRPNWRQVAQ